MTAKTHDPEEGLWLLSEDGTPSEHAAPETDTHKIRTSTYATSKTVSLEYDSFKTDPFEYGTSKTDSFEYGTSEKADNGYTDLATSPIRGWMYTLFKGFIIFILAIVAGIAFQAVLVTFVFSDKACPVTLGTSDFGIISNTPPERTLESTIRILKEFVQDIPMPFKAGGYESKYEDVVNSEKVTHDRLLQILNVTPDPTKLQEWLRIYTSENHVAGRNKGLAERTRDLWKQYGINAWIEQYDVLLNYPINTRVALLRRHNKDDDDDDDMVNEEAGEAKQKVLVIEPQSDTKPDPDKPRWDVQFEATLQEDILSDDPTTGDPNQVPPFHAYSASGNISAPYLYVNYGSKQDFDELLEAKVDLTGKIAIARYGKVFRGLKVKRAQELGMVGMVMYSDPGDDGEITEKNGYKAYPDGPARQESSIQRGSVQFLSTSVGDPTTPGYASKPGVPRQSTHKLIPSIPSLPISYRDAIQLLRVLNGHGPPAKQFSHNWQTGGLHHKHVDYNIGPSPDDVRLYLLNEQTYTISPIWNVIGQIEGHVSNEAVIVGNHRDAWTVGGASDPNSGSTILNEVVRGFGVAVSEGWKPLRTTVFTSWDGEEMGTVGSTEWVEDHFCKLFEVAVAYVNVDTAVSGPGFAANGAPLLHKLMYHSVDQVQSANQTVPNQTIGQAWNATSKGKTQIRAVGGGSDYTAFQHVAGVPILDFGFRTGKEFPVYHYHSQYDSAHWLETKADPGYKISVSAAQLLGVITAELVNRAVLPFSAADYADTLLGYVDGLHTEMMDAHDQPNLAKLTAKLFEFREAGEQLDIRAAELQTEYDDIIREFASSPKETAGWNWPNPGRYLRFVRIVWEIRNINARYKRIERMFLYNKGITTDSKFYKYMVSTPGQWTGYLADTLPPLRWAIRDQNWSAAHEWEDRLTDAVARAVEVAMDGRVTPLGRIPWTDYIGFSTKSDEKKDEGKRVEGGSCNACRV